MGLLGAEKSENIRATVTLTHQQCTIQINGFNQNRFGENFSQ